MLATQNGVDKRGGWWLGYGYTQKHQTTYGKTPQNQRERQRSGDLADTQMLLHRPRAAGGLAVARAVAGKQVVHLLVVDLEVRHLRRATQHSRLAN